MRRNVVNSLLIVSLDQRGFVKPRKEGVVDTKKRGERFKQSGIV